MISLTFVDTDEILWKLEESKGEPGRAIIIVVSKDNFFIIKTITSLLSATLRFDFGLFFRLSLCTGLFVRDPLPPPLLITSRR